MKFFCLNPGKWQLSAAVGHLAVRPVFKSCLSFTRCLLHHNHNHIRRQKSSAQRNLYLLLSCSSSIMFRRHWSGLPKDAEFPSDLEALGYFVNDDDEIRSIDNPDACFRFRIDRNQRINRRRRFEFNTTLARTIHQRLEEEGLVKTRLPLNAGPSEPHVPIFVSAGIASAARIVVLVGDSRQSLGVLAPDVVGGHGGINRGSIVSVVRELHGQVSTAQDSSPPGIVVANPGQLYWWPEGKRALTATESCEVPLPSLVHPGERFRPDVNGVVDNMTPEEHLACVYESVLAPLRDGVKISLVAVGQSCQSVLSLLGTEQTWNLWQAKLDAVLFLGALYPATQCPSQAFKEFLLKRSKAYVTSDEPLNSPLATPAGNPDKNMPALGYPCFSAGEPRYDDMVLIKALKPALGFLEHVATTPAYENPELVIAQRPSLDEDEDENRVPDCKKTVTDWADADDGTK